MPPVTPQITINGTLDDLYGAALADSSLAVQLVNYGSQAPRIAGTAIIASTAPLAIPCPAGTFSFNVWGNDVITPAGTYYIVQILDDNGNVIQTNAYLFTGAQTVDLSTVVPYNPNVIVVPGVPVVAGPLVTLVFNANLVINGLLGTTYDLTLTGNVAVTTFNNVQAGVVYTLILVQDGVGGRTFAYPGNLFGGGPIDPDPGSVTTQSFVARANGNLYATGPAIYT